MRHVALSSQRGFIIRRQCNAMFRYFRNFKSELGRVLTDTATNEPVFFFINNVTSAQNYSLDFFVKIK